MNSLATLGLNLALSQRAQQAQGKELSQERDRQLQAIRLRDSEERRQQELALRRRLAEERARAGGAGVGSSGGSADAILQGLVEESRQLDAARGRARPACASTTFGTATTAAAAAACSTSPGAPCRSATGSGPPRSGRSLLD